MLVALLAALVGNAPHAVWAQTAQVQWQGIERVVAFADVHGAYPQLLGLLRDTGVIDAQEHWAAGRTHLVSLGDLLDRGADSRKVLDLLMRLQGEAQAAGGQVHVLLGNHEVMNLLGDLRYVEPGEFAGYADLESAAVREQQRKSWQEQCAGTCAPFDEKFPRGYFGHRAAFAPAGKYGQWLLGLPVAIVINDTLFMHGGPADALRGLTLQGLNLRYRTALSDLLGAAATPDAVAENPLVGETGPNWYRGAALCNEVTEADVLLPLLQQFGAARLVIGHTPTRNSLAVTRFAGRIVKLDTGMNPVAYKGRASALFIEPSGVVVRYAGQPGGVPPEPEGLFVAPSQLADASVLAALRDGDVTVTGPRGPNELNVTVSHAGRRIPAVFQVRDAGAARKEVAAYKLDRLLQLGIVPVTVERQVQEQRGIVQARPLKWVTQADVQQRKASRAEGWCAAEPQFQLVYAFDTLIGNEGRTAESMVFDADEGFVYATANARAFGTATGLPAYLQPRPPTPGTEYRRRLAALDDAGLRASLGELLDARARAAILTRRDLLLKLPAANVRSRD